ncbi:hypothetical protein MMC20_004608 [Loxospora ochrophaea]|nr:hypothetical protein [Loxospora ochrophaea]
MTTSHEHRTSSEPRQNDIHRVTLSHITQCSPTFLPGQWLDVHVPFIPQAGGFTITSAPTNALSPSPELNGCGYLELAIQNSPSNPPAAWLWQPAEAILGTELQVRVGGRFVWPPPDIDLGDVTNVVMVAGGVGINPLLSILSSLPSNSPLKVHLLYTTRLPTPSSPLTSILFLSRLQSLTPSPLSIFSLYLTSSSVLDSTTDDPSPTPNPTKHDPPLAGINIHTRRLQPSDLLFALGHTQQERARTLCYVCGPKQMTNDVVQVLSGAEGMVPERVLCERWW